MYNIQFTYTVTHCLYFWVTLFAYINLSHSHKTTIIIVVVLYTHLFSLESKPHKTFWLIGSQVNQGIHLFEPILTNQNKINEKFCLWTEYWSHTSEYEGITFILYWCLPVCVCAHIYSSEWSNCIFQVKNIKCFRYIYSTSLTVSTAIFKNKIQKQKQRLIFLARS